MVSIWKWVIWALWLSGLAVLLLALAKVWSDGVLAVGVAICAGIGIGLALRAWWRRYRPRFGPED